MKNRTEEIRRNLEMIAPTWTMLGLALAACGGGGGGGVGSGRVSGPPPINAGAPVARNERIPVVQEAPRGSEPIMLVEGMNSIPDLYHQYESARTSSGTVSHRFVSMISVPAITVDANGNGNIGRVTEEVDGWVLTLNERFDGISLNIRVEINNFIVHYDGLTVDDIDDIVDDPSVSIHGDAASLSSTWTMTYSNGNVRGRAEIIIAGVLGVDDGVPDGSIDIIVSIYEDDVTGDLYFSSGSGRTFLGDLGYSLNLPPNTPGATRLDTTFLGKRVGVDDYDLVVLFSNFAKDGFGNIEIVARDGSIDSLPEVLEIDADGTTGDVYATGHIWYHNGDPVEGATGSVLIAIERGRYHAEVGVDLDGDRIADILVETLPVDIV